MAGWTRWLSGWWMVAGFSGEPEPDDELGESEALPEPAMGFESVAHEEEQTHDDGGGNGLESETAGLGIGELAKAEAEHPGDHGHDDKTGRPIVDVGIGVGESMIVGGLGRP